MSKEVEQSRKVFEAQITELAKERDYRFMNQVLKRDFEGCYSTSWVSSAWMGWCMAMKQQAKQGNK